MSISGNRHWVVRNELLVRVPTASAKCIACLDTEATEPAIYSCSLRLIPLWPSLSYRIG